MLSGNPLSYSGAILTKNVLVLKDTGLTLILVELQRGADELDAMHELDHPTASTKYKCS
jgi:hypothetical protein